MALNLNHFFLVLLLCSSVSFQKDQEDLGASIPSSIETSSSIEMEGRPQEPALRIPQKEESIVDLIQEEIEETKRLIELLEAKIDLLNQLKGSQFEHVSFLLKTNLLHIIKLNLFHFVKESPWPDMKQF